MYYLKIISSMLFLTLIASGTTFLATQKRVHDEALTAKVAHYNPETGSFEWGSIIPQTSTADLFAKAIEPPKEKVAIPNKKPDIKKKNNVT